MNQQAKKQENKVGKAIKLPNSTTDLVGGAEYWPRTTYSAESDQTTIFASLTTNMRAETPLFDIMTLFHAVSEYTGGAVKITSEYKGLPLIPVPESSPVFLYEIVEVLDEITDYDDIISRLPGLTYTQVHGSIMFLRRISQFNAAGVDIDDIEQQAMAEDQTLVESLRGFPQCWRL